MTAKQHHTEHYLTQPFHDRLAGPHRFYPHLAISYQASPFLNLTAMSCLAYPYLTSSCLDRRDQNDGDERFVLAPSHERLHAEI